MEKPDNSPQKQVYRIGSDRKMSLDIDATIDL